MRCASAADTAAAVEVAAAVAGSVAAAAAAPSSSVHPPSPQLPMPHVAGLSFHALLLAASQAGRVFLSRVFF